MLTKKLQDIVDEALNAGLEVSITKKTYMDYYTIRIASGYGDPYYKPNNLMQQIVQWDSISVHAFRIDDKGPYKMSATRLGLGEPVEMDLKVLKYAIEDMGEQVEKHLRNKIKWSTAA